MKNKALKKLTAAIIIIGIANLIASAIFVLTMPDTVPVHFNTSFECDREGSRWVGLIAPAIIAIVFPLCMIGEKKTGNAEKNAKPLTIILTFIDIMVIGMNWFILMIMKSGAEIGDKIPNHFEVISVLIFGLLFVIMGNYLPTVRQNKTLGIKLPWTLKNERCWDATHRFTGKIWVLLGIIMLAVTFILKLAGVESFVPFIIMLLASPAVSVMIPTIYAYQHRND